MAIIIKSNNGKTHYGLVEFTCDDANDIQDLPIDQIWVGSKAFIIDTGETYMFNSEKEWIKITSEGGGGGTGMAATIQVGEVHTGMPGSQVTIENSGTSSAAVFNFSIPRGEPFQIKKIYDSYTDMNNDYSGTDVKVGEIVCVTNGSNEKELWIKGNTQYEFFTSLENVTVVKGEDGAKGSKGDKGDKGDPFIYSDFTPEELEELTGPGITNIELDAQGRLIITIATGDSYTIDFGDIWMRKVNPVGSESMSMNRKAETTIGNYSTTLGYNCEASASYSVAEGQTTKASGLAAHAEGSNSLASGTYAHAEGSYTTASSDYSHAEGYYTEARNTHSHAEGYYSEASGADSHAEGQHTAASGGQSHAEGLYTTASTYQAHAEGSHTTASGTASHAEGYNSTASNDYTHAEGEHTTASGRASHSEGHDTVASGMDSHAEGCTTQATAHYCHSEGSHTVAQREASHAEGSYTQSTGDYAHSEGKNTVASNDASHAEGYYTQATGISSHAEGRYTIAAGQNQHVSGKYNISDSNNTYAEIVGGGSADNERVNIRTLDWSGNATLAGKLTVGTAPVNNMDVATKQYVDAQTVIANPEGTPTTELNSVQIGNTIFKINEVRVSKLLDLRVTINSGGPYNANLPNLAFVDINNNTATLPVYTMTCDKPIQYGSLTVNGAPGVNTDKLPAAFTIAFASEFNIEDFPYIRLTKPGLFSSDVAKNIKIEYSLNGTDYVEIADLVSIDWTSDVHVYDMSNGEEVTTVPEIPTPTISDVGKVLTVDNTGAWELDDVPTELPAVTSADEGKILAVNANGAWAAVDLNGNNIQY